MMATTVGPFPGFSRLSRLARERDDRPEVFEALFHLVTIYLALEELPKAKEACREALRIAADFHLNAMYFPRLFSDMVEMAVKEGRMRRAARLQALVTLFRKPDASFDPGALADAGLPEESVREEWEAARSMNTDQAVAYALSEQE